MEHSKMISTKVLTITQGSGEQQEAKGRVRCIFVIRNTNMFLIYKRCDNGPFSLYHLYNPSEILFQTRKLSSEVSACTWYGRGLEDSMGRPGVPTSSLLTSRRQNPNMEPHSNTNTQNARVGVKGHVHTKPCLQVLHFSIGKTTLSFNLIPFSFLEEWVRGGRYFR